MTSVTAMGAMGARGAWPILMNVQLLELFESSINYFLCNGIVSIYTIPLPKMSNNISSCPPGVWDLQNNKTTKRLNLTDHLHLKIRESKKIDKWEGEGIFSFCCFVNPITVPLGGRYQIQYPPAILAVKSNSYRIYGILIAEHTMFSIL